MKIAVINGQNHKSSTYHIGRQVSEKSDREITGFFLREQYAMLFKIRNTLFALGTVKTDRGKIRKEMF